MNTQFKIQRIEQSDLAPCAEQHLILRTSARNKQVQRGTKCKYDLLTSSEHFPDETDSEFEV